MTKKSRVKGSHRRTEKRGAKQTDLRAGQRERRNQTLQHLDHAASKEKPAMKPLITESPIAGEGVELVVDLETRPIKVDVIVGPKLEPSATEPKHEDRFEEPFVSEPGFSEEVKLVSGRLAEVAEVIGDQITELYKEMKPVKVWNTHTSSWEHRANGQFYDGDFYLLSSPNNHTCTRCLHPILSYTTHCVNRTSSNPDSEPTMVRYHLDCVGGELEEIAGELLMEGVEG